VAAEIRPGKSANIGGTGFPACALLWHSRNTAARGHQPLSKKLLMAAEMEFLLDPLSPNGGEG
jgi:hypothetical protein